MYVLERLMDQGEQQCPKHRWRQYAVCGNRELLERVRVAQRRPGDWRVVFSPDALQLLSKESAWDHRKAG